MLKSGCQVYLIIYTKLLLPDKRCYSGAWPFFAQCLVSSVFWLGLAGISNTVKSSVSSAYGFPYGNSITARNKCRKSGMLLAAVE